MTRPLPEEFISTRKPLLGAEWDAFLESFLIPRSYGLRWNPLKGGASLPFQAEPIPWAAEGHYVSPEEHPGKHPLHEAGAYYIQEPSAMCITSLLEPQPGEAICDLCAAPGGKSTHIAGRMQGQGLLVANEIISSRAKILSRNIERMGIANALVCNENPERMRSLFPLYFDRIAVDAPCSGEGMFRKDDTAIEEWSLAAIALCAKRQRMILGCADAMLKPGGTLVYSTCTFSPEEDEAVVLWFLATHPDYVLEDWRETELGRQTAGYAGHAGLAQGCTSGFMWEDIFSHADDMPAQDIEDWKQYIARHGEGETRKMLRLWPHKLKGEGHFAARLKKTGRGAVSEKNAMAETAHQKRTGRGAVSEKNAMAETAHQKKKGKTGKKQKKNTALSEAAMLFSSFQQDYLSGDIMPAPSPGFALFGEELYLLPPQAPCLDGLKILRAGLHLGTVRKNRFVPAHALAKALPANYARQCHHCTDQEAIQYLKGDTLPCEPTCKGWLLVCYASYPLGWGKAQNGLIKNHFPKGIRWV